MKILNLVFILLFLASCEQEEHFNSVQIGVLEWSDEALSVEEYRNGDPIPFAETAEMWERYAINKIGAYCYVQCDPDDEDHYGYFYNHYAVQDPRQLAPKGWRVPSVSDFENLIASTGGNQVAGNALKSDHFWIKTDNTSGNGSNSSLFDAHPAGVRDVSGFYLELNERGMFWTNEGSHQGAKAFCLLSQSDTAYIAAGDKPGTGGQVKCIKD